MQRIDDKADETYVKAGIYGMPGTGKTNFGVSADNPLILLSERQGMVHVRQAAHRLGKPVPPVIMMDHVEDYRNVARALRGDKSKPFVVHEVLKDETGTRRVPVFELPTWPETIVIDSLTDTCRLIVEGIRTQSPPKEGKDGLPVDSQRFWQVLEDRTRNLILQFRDAPLNVVFLCLADDREVGDDDAKQRVIRPKMPMRVLPDVLCAAVNVMGYTYRRQTREVDKPTALQYGVLTTGPEHMLLKPYRPLRDVETPNFARWCRVIRGEVAADSEPAPRASSESLESPGAASSHAEPTESPAEVPATAPAAKRAKRGAEASA